MRLSSRPNMGVDAAALAETIEAYTLRWTRAWTARSAAPHGQAGGSFPGRARRAVRRSSRNGGVARTEQGEVIRADGEVMPGLFVGGEASCNSAYMGFTLSNCFTWGRIGAQSAAAYLKA